MLHTPTSQPLFIRHKSAAELLEKQAAAVARMPDDDKRWPAQVLSEMHKQLPFLSKFDVDIEMTRIEPEAGYALGYAMLRNKTGKQRAAEELGKPTNKIRVPVIVADRLLQPFHVFEVGGKTYPLTQERVESAMMNPSMFDGISDPPGTQSLLDQIYPPFQHRQGYGMMSGDRATTGLSKLSSAPRVTKTASGEPGPLREFLRQKELEKEANLATNIAGGVRGAFSAARAGMGAAKATGSGLGTQLHAGLGSLRKGFSTGFRRAAVATEDAARTAASAARNTALDQKGLQAATDARVAVARHRAAAPPPTAAVPPSTSGVPTTVSAAPTSAPAAGAIATPATTAAPSPRPKKVKADPLQATSQDTHAWNAYLAENKLPAGTSLEQLRGHQASFERFKAAQPGTEMTFEQFLKHAPPPPVGTGATTTNPGIFQRALSSTAGGATMLGLGAIGGGMMMANKASENY